MPVPAFGGIMPYCNDAICAHTDQRGITRLQGAHCDIGAFEYQFLLLLLA